ncbi:MAG: acyl-CoA dehydrogenase [Thermodesulfobacteriota bacterium]
MAQVISDRRDVDFVLHELLNVTDLTRSEKYAEFNRKTVDLIIGEARNLAIKEILPANKAGDEEGCRFENGTVRVPEAFHRPFQLYAEGEWIAMADDPEVGGQGMPVTVALAATEYFTGANCSLMMYPGLCHGAGKLIEVFGTKQQKDLFLKKMYTGVWGGSMLLTEPQAGSDVGALTTTAVKNPDGTYSITGNKIFITGGEQDLTENIIHPVLARIEGAPAGTRGISLFIVPKIWVHEDGSLGEPNDVVCTGIEHKLGICGSATCSLTLGGKGRCRGFLLGEENKGMRAMFHMMNEARLGVGLQGFAFASASYMYAVNYARERIQGKNLLQMLDSNAPGVPIIQHPDVRRMLMSMKVYVDGMRSFIYFIGNCFDRAATADRPEEKEKYEGFVELLTPILKAYCTEKAFEVCTQGVQVYGGYGYTKEYPVEQLLRDCKITSIYEGTNGIQAMDLLGRKLGMKKGRLFMDFMAEIHKTVETAKAFPGLAELAEKVRQAIDRLGEIAMQLGATAMSPKVLDAFAHAHPFLEVCGDVVMAWMHLWRAAVALPKRDDGRFARDKAFYAGQVNGARYFINSILPATLGKMNAIASMDSVVSEMSEDAFGGK